MRLVLGLGMPLGESQCSEEGGRGGTPPPLEAIPWPSSAGLRQRGGHLGDGRHAAVRRPRPSPLPPHVPHHRVRGRHPIGPAQRHAPSEGLPGGTAAQRAPGHCTCTAQPQEGGRAGPRHEAWEGAARARPPTPELGVVCGGWLGLCQEGGPLGARIFFFWRSALKDRPKRPPTANRHQPPTADHCQPPPTTTNRQSPTANRRQPPPTATNRQSPTANRQSPPTMLEHMSYARSFCKKYRSGTPFFPL